MKAPWLRILPVGLAVSLALGLAFVDMKIHPAAQVLSADSLAEISLLNRQYQMAVEDLSDSQSSLVMTQLYQSNALFTDSAPDPDALGLLATLQNSETVLLLQPVSPLSPDDLSAVAEAYEAAIPEFSHVEADQVLALGSPFLDWNLGASSRIQAPVELSSETVTPVKVAVIDSGVDESHEIFKDSTLDTGWNTLTNNDKMYDDVGHGTHIAGIIASNAPGVEIVPYKIVSAKGGKLSNVLEAFSKALDDGVDIINTSFGVSSPSYALETLVGQAYDEGVVVVSAAGNSGTDTGFYPAHYAQTIAVASVDAGGHQLSTSNYGVWVDVAAYGYHVRSSLPNNQYGYKSGTSQATAFVSAAVARLLQDDPTLSLEDILSRLNEGDNRVADGTLAGTPIVQ